MVKVDEIWPQKVKVEVYYGMEGVDDNDTEENFFTSTRNGMKGNIILKPILIRWLWKIKWERLPRQQPVKSHQGGFGKSKIYAVLSRIL